MVITEYVNGWAPGPVGTISCHSDWSVPTSARLAERRTWHHSELTGFQTTNIWRLQAAWCFICMTHTDTHVVF